MNDIYYIYVHRLPNRYDSYRMSYFDGSFLNSRKTISSASMKQDKNKLNLNIKESINLLVKPFYASYVT